MLRYTYTIFRSRMRGSCPWCCPSQMLIFIHAPEAFTIALCAMVVASASAVSSSKIASCASASSSCLKCTTLHSWLPGETINAKRCHILTWDALQAHTADFVQWISAVTRTGHLTTHALPTRSAPTRPDAEQHLPRHPSRLNLPTPR